MRTLNASCLIVGTSIGAGMLGLPVETSRGGFFPSVVLLLINWAVMTCTALMLVELLNESKRDSNFVSLSEKILGNGFKILTFVFYTGLFLSLTLAYVKGGGVFISDCFNGIPVAFGCLVFLGIFVPLIVSGAKFLTIGNTLLTIGLVVSFVLLVLLGIKKVNVELLSHIDWKFGWMSYPMFITAFGFHSILPSLNSYLQNKKALRLSVVIGTTVTLLIYLAWQMIVMGIVPVYGENGLAQALAADQTAVTPLKLFLKSPLLTALSQVFYFAALTTSFLGVGLGLVDFVLDSFKIKQKLVNRLFVAFLIYVPALWIAQTDLRVFYLSIKYGGGLACFYLLVLLPILLFFRKKRSRLFVK